MFTLQGLSVVLMIFCVYMLLKTDDSRWGIPVVVLVVLSIWTPWKKEVTNIRHLERPVATQEIVEKREGDTETLEEKQKKLVEKANEDN